MTTRAWGLLAAAAVMAVAGWLRGWYELVGLSAGIVTLLAIVLAVAGRRPRVSLEIMRPPVRLTRDDPAEVRLVAGFAAGSGRGRWLSVVSGTDGRETLLARPATGTHARMLVGVNTSRRGPQQLGPYSVEQRDPWGLLRRVVAEAPATGLTIYPRVYEAEARQLLTRELGISANRQPGDDQFHALREYVLGDEPRLIHWRSSARVGQLVVRQHLDSASHGLVLALDVDELAYVRRSRLDNQLDTALFERCVDLVASLGVAAVDWRIPVTLLTTGGSKVVSAAGGTGSGPLMEELALVDLVAPSEATPALLPRLARTSHTGYVVVVTGTPMPDLLRVISRLGRNTLVVRMGDPGGVPRGVRVLEMPAPLRPEAAA
ncbi:MAG: DUF58 domain-containing protein [Candidatus Nanopelagicales bacterium]